MNEPSSSARRKNAISVAGLAMAAGSLAGLCSITAFAGDWWWILDLTSHFRVQYAAVLLGTAMLALARREFRSASIFGAVSVINAAIVLSAIRESHPAPASSKTGAMIRLVYANVYKANHDHDAVRSFLANANADVIVLSEVDRTWMGTLATLTNEFPHVHAEPRDDDFGIALFSKYALIEPETLDLSDAGVPSIAVRIQVGAGRVRIVATHPVPPGSAEGTRLRNEQLGALAELLASSSDPAVLVGDLNTTPWNTAFKRFVRDSGMKNSTDRFRLCATWPTGFFPLRIPIDHCLVSSEVRVTAKATGPNIGSDHYPLIVDLRVP